MQGLCFFCVSCCHSPKGICVPRLQPKGVAKRRPFTIDAAMSDHQLYTLRMYQTLVDEREDWPGRLVLYYGSGAATFGVAPAASISGAASLLFGEEASAIKQFYRRGEIDFVVNSLSEAIRTLKNEIRQKRALSVALVGDQDTVAEEMLERGLQPDAFYMLRGHNAFTPLGRFVNNQRTYRLWGPIPDPERAGWRYTLVFNRKRHYEYFLPVKSYNALRELDARLLEFLPAGDIVRHRWLQRVPSYLMNETDGRWLHLSLDEAAALEAKGLNPQLSPGPPPTELLARSPF